MATKMKFEFEGFDLLVKQINELGGNSKEVASKALKECHKQVTEDSLNAIKPHKRSGRTEESIYKEGVVEWSGNVASISVGFSIRNRWFTINLFNVWYT